MIKRWWLKVPEYPTRWSNAGAILVGILAVPAMLLTACSNAGQVPTDGDPSIGLQNEGAHFWQELGDGTKVECWYITRNSGWNSGTGGPTCDWVGYHQQHDTKK